MERKYVWLIFYFPNKSESIYSAETPIIIIFNPVD